MNKGRRILSIVFLFLLSLPAISQETDTLTVFFRQGQSRLDRSYRGNGERMDSFIKRIKAIKNSNDLFTILSVDYKAGSSPEGSLAGNERLSKMRSKTITDYLHKHLPFADSDVVLTNISEDWDGLAALVQECSYANKQEILDIIAGSSDSGETKKALMTLDGGKAWNYMLTELFPRLRYFSIAISVGIDYPELAYEEEEIEEIDPVYEFTPLQQATSLGITIQEPVYWHRQVKLKTNLIGWAMLAANVAAEIDIAPHFSFALPFYYSGGLDYFKENLKFRGIAIQPEFRWYPKVKSYRNGGFYLGAHLGIGWYNMAVAGDYRIQDHKGTRPALGGGIGLGYTLQFKKNPRWGMEFAIGGGIYDVKYDMLYNEWNGPVYKTGIHNTWFGIDNASVAFTYRFDVKKKGGNK